MPNPVLYDNNIDVPDEMLLGNLLFMNVTDMTASPNEIKNIFAKNGLDEDYVRQIHASDAFRRATSSIKHRKIAVPGEPEIRTEITEVTCDKNIIKRILTFRSIDEVAEEVEYENVAEIIFNRSSESLKVIVYSNFIAANSTLSAEAQKLCHEAEKTYYDWKTYHNRDTIRNIINRIVDDMHPVNLMPTGICKFIPKKYSDTVNGLKGSLEDLNSFTNKPEAENIVETIPVIDTSEQRDLIRKNAESEIYEEMFAITQELKDIIVSKNLIPKKTAMSYAQKLKVIREKISDYNSLIALYDGAIMTQLKEAVKLIDENKEEDACA